MNSCTQFTYRHYHILGQRIHHGESYDRPIPIEIRDGE
jgi:hypothetical protein